MQANLEPLPQLHLPAQKAYAVHSLYAVCFTNNTRKTSQKFLRLSQISHWLQNLTKVLCFLYLGKFCSLQQEGRNSRTAGNHYQVLQYKTCTDTHMHTHTQKKNPLLLSHKKVLSSISTRSLEQIGSQTYLHQPQRLQEPSRAKHAQVPHFFLVQQLLGGPWSLSIQPRYSCTQVNTHQELARKQIIFVIKLTNIHSELLAHTAN